MSNLPAFNEPKFLQRLLASPESRMQALQEMFQNQDLRRMAFHHLNHYGADEHDGEDVFQEAVLIFERAVREQRFKGESSIGTYFVGIVKWYWFNVQRRKKRVTALDPEEHLSEPVESIEASVLMEEKKRLLQSLIEQMNPRCRQLLKLWALSMSSEEIGREADLDTPEKVKKETYRCRTKLKDFVEARPHLKEALKN